MFWKENYKNWLKNSKSNKKEYDFLLELSDFQKKELFSKIITFGKAGLRKIIGFGSNQFNSNSIKQIILSFIDVFSKEYNFNLKEYKFIILHDTRKYSVEISEKISDIFTSFGFDVILNEENKVAPVPFLSYLLVNKYKAFGFMVTASHQTKEYNGCKIFLPQGHIISSKSVCSINNLIKKNNIQYLTKKIISNKKLICFLNKKDKKEYFNEIINLISLPKKSKSRVKILYSSNHGVGFNWVNTLLEKGGYDVKIVKEQCVYDENFSTLNDPNPENDSAFDISIKTAMSFKKKPELLIINDADVDRMRVGVWNKKTKKYKLLVGNEIAAIFIYFLLNEMKLKGGIYMTFVSTDLIYKIAQDFKCKVEKTMTGFYNLAMKYAKDDSKTFLFAFEESIGFLPSREIGNDKDGLQASFLISEIASFLKYKKNITLLDYLEKISDKYGYFNYRQLKINVNNMEQIKQVMNKIKTFKKVGNISIKKITTYFDEGLDNLHQIFFNDGSWIGCRPSVTEPIFKFYFVSNAKTLEKSKIIVENLKNSWQKILKEFKF